MTSVLTRLPVQADLCDEQLLALVQSLPHDSSDRDAACEQLIVRYQSLVRSCAQRYRRSPESQEELMQVGYVGLLKAINKFDPAFGSSLAAYAMPCISGEMKRHFRDKRWQVHVKRSAQELRLEVRRTRDELVQQLARVPDDHEVARHLGISDDELREAQQADLVFQSRSLDEPLSDSQSSQGLGDLLGGEDPAIGHQVDMQAVWSHWDELPEREQHLLNMRFFGNMTQSEIGSRLGISQMHVSRLQAAALGYLRNRLLGAESCSAVSA